MYRREHGYPAVRGANQGHAGRAAGSSGIKAARVARRLAAHRPAACLEGVQQRAGLGRPDGQFGDADRQAR
jgi:hypothetical protein